MREFAEPRVFDTRAAGALRGITTPCEQKKYRIAASDHSILHTVLNSTRLTNHDAPTDRPRRRCVSCNGAGYAIHRRDASRSIVALRLRRENLPQRRAGLVVLCW
jgi:hypothetical protein